MEGDSFINILKKLADRVEEKENGTIPQPQILNRIDLGGFKEVQAQYRNDPSLCKKVLAVEGNWRLDLEYGPPFETKLQTERAGPISIHTDDLTYFGGGGTALHPVSMILAGFCGCYSAAFAKWAAMGGIELKSFTIKAKAFLDFTTCLAIKDGVPIIDSFHLELIVDSDATMEALEEISEITKKRCFCYYCASHSIVPRFIIKKEITEKKPTRHKESTKAVNPYSKKKKGEINRININRFMETQGVFIQNPSYCKKVIEVEGRWRIGIHYGPQFEILLSTEKAGEILVQTDETIILGGGGTSFHPVALCIAGFTGCVATDFARWSAMSGVVLKSFKIKSKMNIDLTSGFGIKDGVPMIDDFVVEFLVDTNETMETLLKIIEVVKKRCVCYNCYITPIIPNVKVIKRTDDIKEIKEIPEILTMEIEHPMEKLHFDNPHNIKTKTRQSVKMNLLLTN